MEKKLFSDRELANFFNTLKKMLDIKLIKPEEFTNIYYRVIAYEFHNE